MELSFDIKENIRKTQAELKNAIRIHQVWAARLEEDENNANLRHRVKEAEKFIIAVSQKQKQIINQLRKDLEYYQQTLKARNKQVNLDNDLRYVAHQINEHITKYKLKNRNNSLLKPSVLSEIHIKTENQNGNHAHANIDKREYARSSVLESRNNFTNALTKVKESFLDNSLKNQIETWQAQSAQVELSPPLSDSSSPSHDSPEPELCISPRALENSRTPITQELFMRMIGLITQEQKESLELKRSERKKRSITSTNRNEFIYGAFDNVKRKKYPNFPYLQNHSTPPQTRSQKQRKEKQKSSENASRETSPSSGENKEVKPSWALSLPKSLTVEPIYSDGRRGCSHCGKNDAERCNCLPSQTQIYKDKLAERNMLQERNRQLKADLRRLEARANTLKQSLNEHSSEKRNLLESQMKTQRNLQQLLDFVGHFKDTSVSITTSSASNSSEQNQA